MAKILALFSGQGSQYPGMGKDLYDNFTKAREVYACAGDLFGFDVAKMSFSGTEEQLGNAEVSQQVIFTLSAAAFAVAKDELPSFAAVAGHSLGEYAAMCSADAYGLEDGMRLLRLRAEAMGRAAKACPGVMYAVVGGDQQAVEAACQQAGGFVLPVNYNLPSQTVISGEEAAAAKAAELLQEQGCKVVRLSVGGAFHTKMMAPAAQELKEGAIDFAYSPMTMDFYSNLTGGRLSVIDYPAYFADHMVSPVRFVEQVEAMGTDGIMACVEFGPKRTASTLVKKNNKAIAAVHVEDTDSLKKAQQALSAL